MTLTVQPVETHYVSQVWPMIERYLLDALIDGNDAPAWSDCYNIPPRSRIFNIGFVVAFGSGRRGQSNSWSSNGVVLELPNEQNRLLSH